MKKTPILALVIAIAVTLYGAWPILDTNRLARAVQARDVAKVSERTDLPALRQSLADQIALTYFRLSGGKTDSLIGQYVVAAAGTIADPIVAKLITPENLVLLISRGDVRAAVPEVESSFEGLSTDAFQNAWKVVANSEFGLRRFSLSVPPDRPRAEQFRLHLRLDGWVWRLVGLDLPEPLRQKIAAALMRAAGAVAVREIRSGSSR
jgi:hypothetical protein